MTELLSDVLQNSSCRFESVSLFVIGTELTKGIIQDKHTILISSELSHLGYDFRRSVIVPDDGSMETFLKEAQKDSDVILVTGGLGPTSDDMTRQIIADIAEVPLERSQSAWDEVYARLGERIWGSNERQAMIPQGFSKIENPKGTAPGFWGLFKAQDGHEVFIAAMPGPPVEMQHMFYNHVLPMLSSAKGHDNSERDEFSVFLTPEAKLEELCASVARPGIMWGTRFQDFKISLYISGASASERRQYEADLSSLLGPGLMVEGNHEAVELYTEYLRQNGLSVSCAESCTSGFAAKLLTDRSGSSSWFWGGACTYANEAKEKMLGVEKTLLETPGLGPVSAECAVQMADGIRRVSQSDLALSTTGYAGPTGEEDGKPAGTVYFGFSSKDRPSQSVRMNFNFFGRDAMRRRFCTALFILALAYAKGESVVDMTKEWVYI